MASSNTSEKTRSPLRREEGINLSSFSVGAPPDEVATDLTGVLDDSPDQDFVAPYCTEEPCVSDDEEDSEAQPEGVAAAYVYRTKIWRDRTELKVYFMESDLRILGKWKVDRSPLTPEVILGWASEWNTELASAIPRFAKEDSRDRADIRVGFGRGGGCWSKVGTDAKAVRVDEPTMNLMLENYPSSFQRYLVIHEFGHVLGLQHEHQRSDFWKVASKFLDPAEMKNDSRMSFVNFVSDIWELPSKAGEDMSPYDPDSIMHYWFDVKWLKKKYKKYQDLNNVKKSMRLSKKEKQVLLGIHKNTKLSERPSRMDLTFLQNHYNKRDSIDYTPEPSSLPPRSGPAAVFYPPSLCGECSAEQQSLLELVRKQLDSLVQIRCLDKGYMSAVLQGSLTDYIERFSTTASPDFTHLKSHLESLHREERLIGDPALLEWASSKVEEKISGQSECGQAIFCEDTVYHASVCCLAMKKCTSNKCLQFFSDRKETRGHDFSEVSMTVEDKERCLIAKQGESTYYIAFQGNTDIQEWPELYSSFSEGIIAQANSVPLLFIVDLLTDPKNRVILTGFCFGGLLASYITTKLWQYTSLGWKHLQKSLVCITFAQPHLPIPELSSFVRDSPEIAQSIHSIYYEQDKIPLVISLLNQKNSCLLVTESSSEPGLHMSVHEEPRTAFEDPLTQTLINQLGTLMKLKQEEEDPELRETLGYISHMPTPLERSYSECYTYHSLCTKQGMAGLIFTEMSSHEVRAKTSCLTLKDVDALFKNLSKHTMRVYVDRLVGGYLDKSPNYSIPTTHPMPQPLKLVQPTFKEIEMAECTTNLSLTVHGENLWFCTKFSLSEHELDFSVKLANNSSFCIKASHPVVNDSVLSEVKDGKQLKVSVSSRFSKPQRTRVPLQRKEYAKAARQRHVEQLSPSQLIELTYLSALLERQPDGHFTTSTDTEKCITAEDFIEKAQKVVPLESIGLAIKSPNSFVSQTCASIVLKHGSKLPNSDDLCELAATKLNKKQDASAVAGQEGSSGGSHLGDSLFGIQRKGSRNLSRQYSHNSKDKMLCGTSIAFLYPGCFESSPSEELKKARSELEDLVKSDSDGNTIFGDKSAVTSVIVDLRQKWLAICLTLLGEYLERQKILVQHGALPRLHDLSEERKLELLSKGELNDAIRLESTILTTLVDRAYAAEIEYSFLLESVIAKVCEERKVKEDYPLDTLIAGWKTIFKNSPLSLMVDLHVPVVARWLKWGLMVNNLRREISENFPPAIGVVGLVNSGKTKLVHTLFGVKVSSGTTGQTRTTIPFIYNLSETVADVDIVDFPGVNDIVDESVSEMAKLILTLAQVILFVVDYRSVNTDVSKKWLHILQSKEVPMLLCLTHADKFYAEHMTDDGRHPEVSVMKSTIDQQMKRTRYGRLDMPPSVNIKFCTVSFDRDSIFVLPENRQRLSDVNISTPRDIGEWVASTFETRLGNSDLAMRLRNFFEKSNVT